jgi:hypothetical protein
MFYVRVYGMSDERFKEYIQDIDFKGIVRLDNGGWYDMKPRMVQAHISFTDEEDALFYILKKGGKIFHDIPVKWLSGDSEV